MDRKQLRHFYFDKTNFSPDDVEARKAHRYVARSRSGEQHPAHNAGDLAVYDVTTNRYLTPGETEKLAFDAAMTEQI